MKKSVKILFPALVLTAMVGLAGCVKTVDELYCLPRRSEGYHNLQAVMDQQMTDLEYSAPASGDNQQAVQMADLNGDGVEEVLLFAKGSDDRPLKLMIFELDGEQYRVIGRLEQAGAAFDQVEYVQMDGSPGLEIVVGTELSDQLPRKVSVYRLANGEPEELMNANYRKFLCCDLDENGTEDLLVFSSDKNSPEHGLVRLYSMTSTGMEHSGEAWLSEPVEQMRRMMTGGLSGGQQGVFVASSVDTETVVTDVLAMVDGELTNVTRSGDTQTSVKTLRNLYVYSEDIDHDGEMELPSLISVRLPAEFPADQGREHLIRWYAVTETGEEVTKEYTYHNYQESWYMKLEESTARRMCVLRQESGAYDFLVWDESGTKLTKLWTVYVLTGADRSALAAEDNRFVLLKTDSVVYAAELEPEAMQMGATEELIRQAFHLIQRGWKTGEM